MSEEIPGTTRQKAQFGLTIYFRRARIRIHRSTIRELEFPSQVRLLMNIQNMKLGVQRCDESERRSFKVPSNLFDETGYFEITSRALLRMIQKYTGWEQGGTYRVYGNVSSKENMILFDLKDYEKINDLSVEEN